MYELTQYMIKCMFGCSLQFVLSKISLGGSEQHRARSVLC